MRPIRSRLTLAALALMISVLIPLRSFAQDHAPYTILHLTPPFGTPLYTEGNALESVFKKSGSWIQWKAQETPGGLYQNKYTFDNLEKMKSGDMPPVVVTTSAATFPWTKEGRPPLDKTPHTESGALFSTSSYISVFLTFDPKIASTRDFAGKKVGIPEKSRIFASTLPLMPYFKKGLGIWDKVEWQYIGVTNSKDALLNDRIDVHAATFMGRAEEAPDGSFVCTAAAPGPPEMELMNSGRKFHVVPFDPEVVKRSYDFSKDMMLYPILIKKGAIKGIEQNVWGIVANGVTKAAIPLPAEVVAEIIRVRYEYRKELAKFHATLNFYPQNPYPAGVPEKWIAPGVKEAVLSLGLEIPKQ